MRIKLTDFLMVEEYKNWGANILYLIEKPNIEIYLYETSN